MKDKSKLEFINNVAKSTGFTIDDVYDLMYGRIPWDYGDQHKKLIQALAKDGQGIIFGVVWKGKNDLKHLRHSPMYFYLGQLLQGANLGLYQHGYALQVFFNNKLLADQAYFEQIIADRPNAGFINIAYISANLQTIYDKLKRPIVYIDYPSELDITDKYVIALNNTNTFEQIVARLYELGHRRIAFIKSPQHKRSFVDRYNGYLNGLKKVGLSVEESLIYSGNWYESSGEDAARAFLALSTRPTAILSSNDEMAIGAMSVLQEQGLRIPNDISVIGFDDIAQATQHSPPLSSVSTPITQLGSHAAEYIVSLLEGKSPSPKQIYLPTEIIYRESVGPVPKS